MEDEEKRWNRAMAVICFFIMIGIVTFMIWKNQNTEVEDVPNPSPTVEMTIDPME
ncbi:MAG: hypothetical protein HFJ09_06660 [Lachnospiraceae bacterium]|nr:hypothetical protein [Lachnospiraceae bacterium]